MGTRRSPSAAASHWLDCPPVGHPERTREGPRSPVAAALGAASNPANMRSLDSCQKWKLEASSLRVSQIFVLFFPPLRSRLRFFLIKKLTESKNN